MSDKTQRGGARVGAGAKPKIEDGKRVQVYLDAQSQAIASALGGGNVSEGIRKALKIVALRNNLQNSEFVR